MNRSRIRGPYVRFCERDEVKNFRLTLLDETCQLILVYIGRGGF